MTETNNHGGSRSGAGRPKKHVGDANAVVGKKLASKAEFGYEVLAESYPDIMRKSIEMALGKEADDAGKGGRQPDRTMLKALLELVPKLVGNTEDGKPSQITLLIQDHLDRVAEKRDGPA